MPAFRPSAMPPIGAAWYRGVVIPAKPLIALTCGRRNLATEAGALQTVLTGCDMQYVDAVVRAGGAPLLVPCVSDPQILEAVAGRTDGVLLTGGGDVSPMEYGEEPHPKTSLQDPVRDALELGLARLAVERGLPLLGVCRGIQTLNIALGGTLVQDIPSQVTGALLHSARPVVPTGIHSVSVEPGSLLARVMGEAPLAVNSYHHQAVKDLGRGLRVNCTALDGVIEGVEAEDGRPILAVQFHPEELAARDARFQSLFDWLVREAVGKG